MILHNRDHLYEMLFRLIWPTVKLILVYRRYIISKGCRLIWLVQRSLNRWSHILHWMHYFTILWKIVLYKCFLPFVFTLMDFSLKWAFRSYTSRKVILRCILGYSFFSIEPWRHKLMKVVLWRHVKILLTETITKTILTSMTETLLYSYGHEDFRKAAWIKHDLELVFKFTFLFMTL